MQKVKKANAAKRLCRYSIILAILFFFKTSYGQEQDFSFQRSFIGSFRYPDVLREVCNSTYTNLLIQVSTNGKVENIMLSDSAPESFKREFYLIRAKLDLDALKRVISSNHLKDCNIVIPVFYTYAAEYCSNYIESTGYLSDTYLSFSGKTLKKLSFHMKPIIELVNKPIR
jgi:hypothetical protein